MTNGSPAKPASTPTSSKPRAPGTKIDNTQHPTWNESHNSMKIKNKKNRSQSAPKTVKDKTPEELEHNALKAKTAKK